MSHTQELAIQYALSRRVLTVQEQDKHYKVHVEISGLSRCECSYYFIPKSADISQVCPAAIDLATEAFLGMQSSVAVANIVKQIEMELEKDNNAPSINKEKPNDEITKQEESKQESGKQEASSQKKSRSKKSQVVSESAPSDAHPEEMEAVESPYKDDKKSSAEPYNREDKTSKASFASYATRLHKGSKEWKAREDLKAISNALHGMPFLMKDGSIHSDFDKKCKELFGLDDEAAL